MLPSAHNRIIFTVFVSILLIFSVWIVFSTPDRAAFFFKNQLILPVFSSAHVQSEDIKFDRIVFDKIALDEKGFGTIDRIEFVYDWIDFLFHGTAKSLEIENLELTVTINKEGQIKIGGLNDDFSFLRIPEILRRFENLGIKKGRLDILSEFYGGFSINFDIQMRTDSAGKRHIIIGSIHSAQHQLQTDVKISGYIEKNNDWPWHFDINFEDTRLRLYGLEVTRLSSNLTADGNFKGFYHIENEFDAGGLSFGSLAWHNVTGIFQSNQDETNFNITANTLGVDDMEFSVTYDPNGAGTLNGTIYTPSLNDFKNYCQRHNIEFVMNAKSENAENEKEIFMEYLIPLPKVLDEDLRKPSIKVTLAPDFWDTNTIQVQITQKPD